MAQLSFETLRFREKEDVIQVDLLTSWMCEIPKEEVAAIAEFEIVDASTISFAMEEEKARVKFGFLLQKYFDKNLVTKITGNPCTYIHRNSDIPLIGHVAFGIVYRGSSIIEIKTNNGCNLDCVYCSISEGLSSKKHDFVIEKDYLIEELEKLMEYIGESVEVHIGVQGEPFLYGDMENLIIDLQDMENVHTISIDTNGSLLNKERIDRLSGCRKLQFNLSLDAIDSEVARKVAGTKVYNVEHVKKMIAYASEKCTVIVAPVLTQGYNEEEVEKIVAWVASLEHKPILGIQNFLRYKTGRNPAKEMKWDDFYALLDRLEKKYGIKLRLRKEDFNIRKTKPLEKPFEVGDEVAAVMKCPDRFKDSVIAVAQGRIISVPGVKFVAEKKIQVKITRDKHNIFTGKVVY